jgi:hypothetical protein
MLHLVLAATMLVLLAVLLLLLLLLLLGDHCVAPSSGGSGKCLAYAMPGVHRTG